MKKLIACLKDHPEIDSLFKEMDKKGQTAAERCNFFMGKIRQERKNIETDAKEMWGKIEKYLGENKLLPEEYNRDKFALQNDCDVIFMRDTPQSSSEMLEFVKNELEKLHPEGPGSGA